MKRQRHHADQHDNADRNREEDATNDGSEHRPFGRQLAVEGCDRPVRATSGKVMTRPPGRDVECPSLSLPRAPAA